MKTNLLFTLAATLALNYGMAQSLSPTVVSPSGAFYQNGTGMLSTTVGEMSMVQTFSSGSVILTQGFQQAFDFGVGIHESPATYAFSLYPNPTTGNVVLQIPEGISGDVDLLLFDAVGQLVWQKSFGVLSGGSTAALSLESLAEGSYFIALNNSGKQYFSKLNIIH